jgi:hypothetical protein
MPQKNIQKGQSWVMNHESWAIMSQYQISLKCT